MKILLDQQLLKIIFVGLTGSVYFETGSVYFDSMKEGDGMATA
ncbi:MAG: hypothetical protein ABSD50_17755 [Smithella sp.]